ncbi:hypothetical protein ACLOJK_028201 [Asimina triloba]
MRLSSLPKSVSPPVFVGDIEGDHSSPNPALELANFEEQGRQGVWTNAAGVEGSMQRRDADPSGAEAPMCRGVLGSTFGEASSCLSSEQSSARAMKILENLLPVQSRAIREYYALSLPPTLDVEGARSHPSSNPRRRGGEESCERMLLDRVPDVWKELSELEERIRLLDGCSSREEYHYHVLRKRSTPDQFPVDRPHAQDRFGVTSIMEEEERRKIIVVGKHLEKVAMEQVSRKALRLDVSVLFEWELLEKTLVKVRGMVRERLETEGERCHVEGMVEGERRLFFQLLKMGRCANQAEARREVVEKAVARLCSVLDAMRAELEVARAKQAQEEASKLAERVEAIKRAAAAEEKVVQPLMEPVALRPEAESLRDVDPDAGEGSSLNGEVSVLRERIVVLSSRESKLLVESDKMQVEVVWFQTELKTL